MNNKQMYEKRQLESQKIRDYLDDLNRKIREKVYASVGKRK